MKDEGWKGRIKILDLEKKGVIASLPADLGREHLKNFGILNRPSCDVAISVGRMNGSSEKREIRNKGACPEEFRRIKKLNRRFKSFRNGIDIII